MGDTFKDQGKKWSDENKVKFLSDLAHELSHLLSFYSLAIKEEDKIRHINVRQSGCSNLWKKYYDGLNEAVTELWSKVILREFFRIYPNILSEKEKDIALNYYGYPYHATLIEEIIYNLVDNNVLVWPLFKSYFFGSRKSKEQPLRQNLLLQR